ncbi:MAG: hypothetical protein K0U86_17000 [Planctomycetes bacterium]|nr:hypothetical protein [Planctomycetota bacterium]MCH9726601.1 hypothetical protein [Planctomycetota bacterium]MCH9779270.1 hypothetical protein [Planctomycetota bacterium]MCH9792766.1 hypothetical protein [Planctomycetota bacterium]
MTIFKHQNRSRLLTMLLMAMIAFAIELPSAWSQQMVGGRKYNSGNQFYHPLNQRTPPGVAGQWAAISGQVQAGYIQPMQVSLPSKGVVTFYAGSVDRKIQKASPAPIGFSVGYVYRIKISGMPEFPGVELYPTIELIDRLHPPAGLAETYPVPVSLNPEDIELALSGRMVTKVVYLERPQTAVPAKFERQPTLAITAKKNLIAEADLLGRPMAIIRMGGRLPSTRGDDPAFFGSGAPVVELKNNRTQN